LVDSQPSWGVLSVRDLGPGGCAYATVALRRESRPNASVTGLDERARQLRARHVGRSSSGSAACVRHDGAKCAERFLTEHNASN